ncbi:protein-L-isoaspartate O-methyltransferase family protein [Quisquiliibacterium transsilvanicum]|uniref:Protein-L-isoaspartate O-methyltransferase n=1 Tax=Quisquiliibacterium transsilvanicum TaxID=1549638 RepID=A0A7W8HK47_9BURK|nr:protein-L-isoaspartate O-methyltransferase [Quisquiliibacterium transsilvanicum]MBB5273515.1 protein-L-isoaspartate(D-aspartate) O-methyltransferase [Quisquiliibacterium transsilvanicum]
MDFERARYNMVEQQIRPWDVLDQEVLDLLLVVRREDFVPPAYRAIAFVDMEVPLLIDGARTGECMLSPKVEARLLQNLSVRRHEHVLEIGAGSGHMAALLAHRARHVVSCEIHPGLAAFARVNLDRAGVRNAVVEQRDGAQPAGPASYEVILLSGSVPFVPEALLHRLTIGGRLAAVVGDAPAMEAQLITRTGPDSFTAETLFETVAPRLHGFPEKDAFRF